MKKHIINMAGPIEVQLFDGREDIWLMLLCTFGKTSVSRQQSTLESKIIAKRLHATCAGGQTKLGHGIHAGHSAKIMLPTVGADQGTSF